MERLEQQRLDALRAERKAEEKAKRDREAAEAKRLEEIEQAKKTEAMKPDREKAATMAAGLASIEWPEAATQDGRDCFEEAKASVTSGVLLLRQFSKGKQ